MSGPVQDIPGLASWDWPRRRALGNHGRPVRLGVIILCHDQLELATELALHWSNGAEALAIHVDRAADAPALAGMKTALSSQENIVWAKGRSCEWGRFSLVQATQDCAKLLLENFPEVTHVILVSGSCMPLRPISELVAYLQRYPERDYIESVTVADSGWVVGGLGAERFKFYFPFSWRHRRGLFDKCVALQRRLRVRRRVPRGLNPHIGSQWWCLTRNTLAAILDDPRRAEYDRFFRLVWIPDESYFQTLARLHSNALESRSLTLAKFDSQGKPYIFYDDHLKMLEESRCFIARKIWPHAYQLRSHFPLASSVGLRVDTPRPARIEKLLTKAVERRAHGRAGLYMQSRFPLKDRENGKTSGRYMFFQGFDDAMPGFEKWLAEILPVGTVHGHLFAKDRVQFAGGARVGPGSLSDSAALRDNDARGFLASLVRMGEGMQIFQFGPRDSQDLNWFMTTDPNAHIAVVTGAWVLPLMHSQMPFDDIRRVAARLQETEADQLEVLRSVWTKANVKIWELADLIADPETVVGEALQMVAPQAKLGPMPPMLPTNELVGFLQALRNAGLRPRLIGEIEATRSISEE